MNRYKFLNEHEIHSALNKLRDAFLAAKSGEEVDTIINGLLTLDEKMKIGRRILVAEHLKNELTFDQITEMLNVGKTTITLVSNSMILHPDCFELIENRSEKVKKALVKNKYRQIGGSKLIHKKREYTGFTRKNVKR